MRPAYHGGAPRRRHRWSLGLAPGALLLAGIAGIGCAGPGQSLQHRTLEEQWRSSDPGREPSPSDDPLAGAAVLDRETLIREVLRRNPTLGAARFAWRAALARYPQATSLDDPMLAYGVAPASFGSSRVDGAHRVELSQKLPFPGKLTLRGEMALAEAAATAHEFEAVRLRLATMASLLFDEYYLLARSLEINTAHRQLLGEFQRIAIARYEAGEASQQAPLQAEVELGRLLSQEVELDSQRRVVAEQIDALLHRRVEHPLPPPPTRLTLPPPDDLDRTERVARALDNRPELHAAAARVRSLEAAVDLARREFLPDLTLIGAYNGVMQESDLQPFVGVAINVPLRISRRRAALDEARARLELARRERESVEDEVRLAVQSGTDRLSEARQVLELYRDRLLPAARDQVAAARAGFETGRNSFLAVIEAERNLRTIELGQEEAIAAVSRRFAELERATGNLPGGR